MSDKPVVNIVCNSDTDEVMVTWPSGQVQFISSFLEILKLLWFIVRNGADIKVRFGRSSKVNW